MRTPQENRLFMMLRLATAGFLLLYGLGCPSLWAAPNQISYQGFLTNSIGQPVVDSSYQVTFRLYRALLGGASLWNETAAIETHSGLFNHNLGSVTQLPSILFTASDSLFLELQIDGLPLTPRTRLVSTPFAMQSGGLRVGTSANQTVIQTLADSATLTINKPNGDTSIILRGNRNGDSAVLLPTGAISADEIADEPGIAVFINTTPVTLVNGMMVDIVTLEFTAPDDGYVILEGKCYVELRGTVGANRALIQIDDEESGSSEFPYFSLVGLSGYVNTGSNYFSVYVTRPFFVEKGTHTFRMEGRAQNGTPAEAIAWDPVLNATYYTTSYEAVKSISSEPGTDGIKVTVDSLHPGDIPATHQYYLHDLRKRDTRNTKKQPAPQK